MKIKTIILACLLVCSFFEKSYAREKDASSESGFSGYLSIVCGALGTESNFYALEGQKFAIDDLIGELEDGISQGLFGIFGEISYLFEGGQQVYLGFPFDERNPRRFSFNQMISLGLVQSFPDFGRIDLSLNYSEEKKVWENPYLTGEERTAAGSLMYGAIFDYDHILGTGFNFFYNFKRNDMDKNDDVIGSLYPDLEREGFVHTAEFEYDFLMGKRHMFTPGLSLTKGDMEGKSNAYNGFSAKFAYTYDKESFVLNYSTSAGRQIYDKTHPLFNEKRKDNVFSTSLGLTLIGNIGFEGVFVHCNINAEKHESNIDFCDGGTLATFIAVGYNF